MRQKATQALQAWAGEIPSLGERAAASLARAAQDAAAETVTPPGEPPGSSGSSGSSEPVGSADGRPMPPVGASGSWVWVTLPDGAGVICARARGWTRVTPDRLSPGGWAMKVTAPKWVEMQAWTGAGGSRAQATDEGQVVPGSMVEPIPGHYSAPHPGAIQDES